MMDQKGSLAKDPSECPHPKDSIIKWGKKGKRKEKQRYYCRKCGKTFTGDLFEEEKNLQKVLTVQLWLEGATEADIAEHLSMDPSTVHSWVSKYCEDLKGIRLKDRSVRAVWKVLNVRKLMDALDEPEKGSVQNEASDQKETPSYQIKDVSGVANGGGNREPHILLITSWMPPGAGEE